MKPFAFALLLLIVLAGAAPAQEKIPFLPKDKEVFTTESGLKYSILKQGDEGARPALGDRVTIEYTGWLEDGTVFDSTERRGQPSRELLLQKILGLREGIRLMTKGAKFKFVVPPDLGFGRRGHRAERGMPRIPPNATLVFEVELKDFTKGPRLPKFHGGNLANQKVLDSGMVYEILKPGNGTKPKEGEMVDVEYAIWNKKGELVDCSAIKDFHLEYLVGRARMRLLNEGMVLMEEGSRFRFEVPPEMAFGSEGAGPLVPPNTPTIWELELRRIVRPPAFGPSPPDKLKTTGTGLQYEVVREGSGIFPKEGFNARIHYVGWLEDGTQIDSSYARGQSDLIAVGLMIDGINEGLQLMREGAIYKFTIPGALGYGEEGAPPRIPPNATLHFHVELVKVIDPKSLQPE